MLMMIILIFVNSAPSSEETMIRGTVHQRAHDETQIEY